MNSPGSRYCQMTDRNMIYKRAGVLFDRVREKAGSKTSLTHKLTTKLAGFGTTETRRQTKARFTRYSIRVTVRAVQQYPIILQSAALLVSRECPEVNL